MELPLFVVDAFSSTVFAGNPAAVCPLEHWLPDRILQDIAAENNLPETAFIVRNPSHYELRWFTPVFEIDLCGHATLGAAHVIFQFYAQESDELIFQSKSGPLYVKRDGNMLTLDFPARPGTPTPCPSELSAALNLVPREVFMARDYLVIVDSAEMVRSCRPDFETLARLPALGTIISAPGSDCDFVSRVFFPTDSIKEDPVTGSAHCTLVPYWAKRLNKSRLHARQISARGGELWCEDRGAGGVVSTGADRHWEGQGGRVEPIAGVKFL